MYFDRRLEKLCKIYDFKHSDEELNNLTEEIKTESLSNLREKMGFEHVDVFISRSCMCFYIML